MDMRNRNRRREHLPHGLRDTKATNPKQPGHTLFRCPCGWLGWLKPDAESTDAS